jgi:hypothetical protein
VGANALLMDTQHYSLPIELYDDLQSILLRSGIESTNISLDVDYGPMTDAYIEEVKQGKRKTLLIYVDGFPQFIHSNTIDFSESFESTLNLGYPGRKGFKETLKLIEPILLKHGGVRL